MTQYNKPPITISEQVALLRSKGVIIDNESLAARYLQVVSYYRLSGYFKVFQDKQKLFYDNVTFDRIIKLYDIDSILRQLFFEALEKIEIAAKTIVSNHMSLQYGAYWYESNHFKTLRISELVSKHKGIYDGKTHSFIKHYREKYSSPYNLPSWMVCEILGFSDISKIVSQLTNQDMKGLSNFFNHSPRVLKSWLHSLTVTRNVCAHHSRLWNRIFHIAPERTKEISKDILSKSLAEQIIIIAYMVSKIDQNDKWFLKVKKVIEDIHLVADIKEAGFIDIHQLNKF